MKVYVSLLFVSWPFLLMICTACNGVAATEAVCTYRLVYACGVVCIYVRCSRFAAAFSAVNWMLTILPLYRYTYVQTATARCWHCAFPLSAPDSTQNIVVEWFCCFFSHRNAARRILSRFRTRSTIHDASTILRSCHLVLFCGGTTYIQTVSSLLALL